MNNIKGKKRKNLILLALLMFTISRCFQDHVNAGLPDADSWPDYGRTVATDVFTNNLMNAGCLANYGDTTLYAWRNGDKAVYKIEDPDYTFKMVDGIQASQLLVNDKCGFIIDHEH